MEMLVHTIGVGRIFFSPIDYFKEGQLTLVLQTRINVSQMCKRLNK